MSNPERVSLNQLNSKTNDLVLLLKTINFKCTETGSCRLLLGMAWMEMD